MKDRADRVAQYHDKLTNVPAGALSDVAVDLAELTAAAVTQQQTAIACDDVPGAIATFTEVVTAFQQGAAEDLFASDVELAAFVRVQSRHAVARLLVLTNTVLTALEAQATTGSARKSVSQLVQIASSLTQLLHVFQKQPTADPSVLVTDADIEGELDRLRARRIALLPSAVGAPAA